MADHDPLVITLGDVYLAVRKVEEAVGIIPAQAQTIGDHEKRLRSIERWLYALPISVLLAIGSAVWAQVAPNH